MLIVQALHFKLFIFWCMNTAMLFLSAFYKKHGLGIQRFIKILWTTSDRITLWWLLFILKTWIFKLLSIFLSIRMINIITLPKEVMFPVLSVCGQDYTQTNWPVFMKLLEMYSMGQGRNQLTIFPTGSSYTFWSFALHSWDLHSFEYCRSKCYQPDFYETWWNGIS